MIKVKRTFKHSSQWKEYMEKIKRLKLSRYIFMLSSIKDSSDVRLEPILQKLKDLDVIKSWYYNGTYHAC